MIADDFPAIAARMAELRAPAVVRTPGLLMAVKPVPPLALRPWTEDDWKRWEARFMERERAETEFYRGPLAQMPRCAPFRIEVEPHPPSHTMRFRLIPIIRPGWDDCLRKDLP